MVSALVPILQERDGSWVGWTGVADFAPKTFSHDGIENRPVPLSAAEIDSYYVGFSNGTLWPLYHDALRVPQYHRHWWGPYQEVNRRFAAETALALGPGDVAWVHDYQLQLVPGMLRELRDDVTIGFYLHIPFPPVELFARLPWRREMLHGLLGADVIAFQTQLGRHNFARCAKRFAGAEGGTRQLRIGDRIVRLKTAPISIDTPKIVQAAQSPAVQRAATRLREELGSDRTVVLGVDRMDYTKGIDVRLRAFETLLESHSADDLVFVQVAVPSREEVGDYSAMRAEVEHIVGRINGEYGRPGHVPVHYLYRSVPFEQLVAYYTVADVMTVTPLRDGLNLVAKEYVASRIGGDGVLLLSEFAGAAQQLQSAVIVNPHDLDGVAAALAQAVVMPKEEQRQRMGRMRRQVQVHDVFDWAQKCLTDLNA
ncbi:MAG: trehalose-6-phosphate synthase [Acidimicrobiia bacterium]|nr:MAG: trehalose-6-phosphate synthase [Acidimicrobiia bacterium]